MENFKKIIRLGHNEVIGNVYVSIKFKNKRLSLYGVEGPLNNGNWKGGCGQIELSIDDQYVDALSFAPGWDKDKIKRLLGVWRAWHLNDMNAGCEHQRAAQWDKVRINPEELPNSHANRDKDGILAIWVTPKEHIEGLLGRKCIECGYKYGTAWLHEDVPESVLEWLYNLPETDKTPTWT